MNAKTEVELKELSRVDGRFYQLGDLVDAYKNEKKGLKAVRKLIKVERGSLEKVVGLNPSDKTNTAIRYGKLDEIAKAYVSLKEEGDRKKNGERLEALMNEIVDEVTEIDDILNPVSEEVKKEGKAPKIPAAVLDFIKDNIGPALLAVGPLALKVARKKFGV